MVDPFHPCLIGPPILGVDNIVSFQDVISDTGPHLFKFWGAGDVNNSFLVDPTLNITKTFLLVTGSGPCVAVCNRPYVPLPHIC